MVFESLVAEVLNRFLGSYVENLDTNQLKIGIWGGDVVLTNLVIKSTALSDLDLPIKLYQGHLGKLTLKIPWKNLYGAPTIATIDNLYVLLVPNTVGKYDEKSEEKAIQEIKQKELTKIEEAKKRQDMLKDTSGKQDTFVEKMVSQIIKNLQIKITSIHLRYEDTFSNPSKPFAFGFTLNYLSFDTTDEKWKPCIATDAIKMIYKIVRLDALCIYWNSSMSPATSYIKLDKETMLNAFVKGIAQSNNSNSPSTPQTTSSLNTPGIKESINNSGNGKEDANLPPGYNYILKPLTSLAQLRLNSKPELDGTNFTTPKILLNLIIQGISLALSQTQYQDILEMLESFETLTLKSKYRKYRPDLSSYEGHYKNWWHFAQNVVLDEIVKPRLLQWSWKHIQAHRELVKRYAEAYKIKLTTKKLSPDIKNILDEAEKRLDVFNITIARQKASLEAQRISQKSPEANRGWFSGWFKRTDERQDDSKLDSGIAAKLNEAMSPEERKKLYEAIDYTETGVPPEYPREFVQNVFHFKLVKLSFSLYTLNIINENRLTDLNLSGLGITYEQCPGANASQIEINMDNFNVRGKSNYYQQNPMIVKTLKSEYTENLISILYESNPLDGTCDQRLHLQANPLEIIYDAGTINDIGQFFKPPDSIKLKQLQNAAVSTFEDVKQNTATGYKYALEKRKILDLKFNIKSSHVIIPNDGIYKDDSDIILVDLGNFSLNSVADYEIKDFNAYITRLSPQSDEKGKEIESLMQQSYDKIELKIERIQIIYALKSDDWKKIQNLDDSPLHVLKPGDIKILLEKAIIMDDPNIPKIRVFGILPDFTVDIVDKRLEGIIELLLSIPLPESPQQTSTIETAVPDGPDLMTQRPNSELKNFNAAQKLNKEALLLNIHDDSDELFQSGEDSFKLAEKEVIDGGEKDLRADAKYEYNQQQLTSLVLHLEIKLVQLNLYRLHNLNGSDATQTNEKLVVDATHMKVASFVINSLGAYVESRTFETSIRAHLKAVLLQNFEFQDSSNNEALYLIQTSSANQNEDYFLQSHMIIADVNGPKFVSDYGNTEKMVDVKFCPLNLKLHQQAVLKILQMVERLQTNLTIKSKKSSIPSNKDGNDVDNNKLGSITASKRSTIGGANKSGIAVRKRFLTEANITNIEEGDEEEDELSWSTAPISLASRNLKSPQFSSGDKKRQVYAKSHSVVSPSQITTVGIGNNARQLVYKTPPTSIKPDDSAMSNISASGTSGLFKRQSSISTYNRLKEQPLVMSPRRNKNNEVIIDMCINVYLMSVSLNLCTIEDDIATISVKGLQSQIQMRRDKMDIHVELNDIGVLDNLLKHTNAIKSKTPSTSFYRQIISGTPAGTESELNQSKASSPVFVKANVTLFNNGPGNQIWKNDTSPDTQNFFKKFILYDMSRVDTRIDASLGGIRVVILMPFFNKVLRVFESFISSNTKTKMAEASAAAAAEVASSTYASVSRNLLNVEMKAPVFIIPRSNAYPNAALLDLGNLKLTNRFTLHKLPPLSTPNQPKSSVSQVVQNQTSDHATTILDKLMIELTDFKISHIITDNSGDAFFKAEVRLLEPANINLEVRRNLSFATNKNIPEIDISGHLSKTNTQEHDEIDKLTSYANVKGLELSLSEEDLNCLMKILYENLTLPLPPPTQVALTVAPDEKMGVQPTPEQLFEPTEGNYVPRKSSKSTAAGAVDRKLSNLRKSMQVELLKNVQGQQQQQNEPTKNTEIPGTINLPSPIKINFRFQFDKIAAALYYGTSELEKGGIRKRNNLKALSHIELIYIHIIGNMRENGHLDTTISLYDLNLEDNRPQLVNGVTKLIEMKKTDLPVETGNFDSTIKDRVGNLINFRFQRDHNENMKINAALNKLYICVYIDYLMSISDFFTKNMPNKEQINETLQASNNPNNLKIAKLPPPPSRKENCQVKRVMPKTAFGLEISLNDPEIILIENPFDQNTKALILTLHLHLLYDQTPEKTFIDGKLSNLQIVASQLPKHLRENNMAQILLPFNLDITCDSLNRTGQNIFVKASDIILNISPATIRVLTAATKMERSSKPLDTKEELLSLPEDMWNVKNLNDSNFWFLETEYGDEAMKNLDLASHYLTDEDEENEDEENEAENLANDNTSLDSTSETQSITKNLEYLQQLELTLNSILITIEAGVENRTVPMIKSQIKILYARLQDWSSDEMKAHLKLSLEAGYYNEYLALWEPLIEPLITHNKELDYQYDDADTDTHSSEMGDKIQRPWELFVDLKKYPDYFDNNGYNRDYNRNEVPLGGRNSPRSPPDSQNGPGDSPLLPSTYIGVSSKDLLNITLTKCSMQMINKLSSAFGDAMNQKEPKVLTDEMNSPLVIINKLGIPIEVNPDASLKVYKSSTQPSTQAYIPIANDSNLPLFEDDSNKSFSTRKQPLKQQSSMNSLRYRYTRSSILDTDKGIEYYLTFKFPELGQSMPRVSVKQVRRIYLEISSGSAKSLAAAKDPIKIGIVIDVAFQYGCKRITVQSPLKIINYFAIPIEIYTLEDGSSSLIKLISLEMDQNWDVPIRIAYKCPKLFFKPANEPYDISKDSVDWRSHPNNLNPNLKYVISCSPHNPQYEAFYLSITEISENIYGQSENEPIRDFNNALYRTLHIMPTVTLINLLPFTITHKLSYSNTEVKVDPGSTSALYNACVGKSNIEIKLKNYIERDWVCTLALNPHFEEFQVKAFTAPSKRRGGKIYSLDMGLHWFKNKGMIEISIFCPYWMINQTGLNLFYKEEDEDTIMVEHKPGLKLPILFSFKPKTFFSKKKVSMKVQDSDWSEKFSLDTVGNSGVVACKTNDSSYEIGVDIVLSKTGFTKIVTFVPYYTVNNKSKLDIQFIEYFENQTRLDGTKWLTVNAGEVVPFWPKQPPTTKNLALIAKYKDSTTCTSPFPINRTNHTLMRLDNKFGGINVECHVTDIAITITLDQYYHGQAVLLVINHTGEETVQYYQNGTKDLYTLPPRNSILYSWQNALLPEKTLIWSCGDKKNQKFDTLKDSFGDFVAADRHRIYWVSFLDGTQRILMFTEDLALICIAQQAGELEKVDQEIELNLEGVSLSLVDNWQMMTELTYMSIISSGQPVWEISSSSVTIPSHYTNWDKEETNVQAKLSKLCQLLAQAHFKTKFKALKSKEALLLEQAYQYFTHDPLKIMNSSQGTVTACSTNLALAKKYNNIMSNSSVNIFSKSGLFLDLDHMVMVKLKSNNINNINNFSDISYYYCVKRTFRPGFWVQYKTSPHQVQLHSRLNKIQIDDQLPACTFPVILGLMPLPKSISNDSSVPKPFIELSLLKRNTEHGGVSQVKYFKILVQETFLRSDQGYIDAVVAFFTQPITSSLSGNAEQSNQIHESFLVDIEMAKQDLVRASADKVKTSGQKIFYDFLHFSPIKIHLSFSLQSNRSTSLNRQKTSNEAQNSREASTAYQQQQSLLSNQEIGGRNNLTTISGSKSPSMGRQGSNNPNEEYKGTTPQPAIKSAALNFLLQSVGVTLADIDDVVFKLGYFERTYQFYTQSQLIQEVTRHYVAQALKQMYVLVLGLDVLGNPFGLIRGLTEGMGDLFYEPYQGAIQGPEEFAQGLALGVRSLFGHTIGGAAGAVSRITGTLGKGLAALTMDQDYQKSRREEMNKKPADFKEGVARGGKGLVMGFYEGVTGIVKKPIEGAKEEGAAGFFKGFGKGLVGVVARPTSGVVDFASSSFQGIKRLAENVEEVHRLRPRRYIHKDHVIRPYDYDEAEGYEIFRAVEKGHIDQIYIYHSFLSSSMKSVIILTNQSLFLISKGELFGQWVIDWSYDWNQILRTPIYTDRSGGIKIEVQGESRKKKCMPSLIPKEAENYRLIPIKNKKKAEDIMGKMNEMLDKTTRGL